MTNYPANSGYSAGVPAANAPMNVLSVVAFVLSLVGFNVIAVILGAVGLSQIKKTGERGRGFALAAIWIGVISLVLLIIVIIVAVVVSAAAINAS